MKMGQLTTVQYSTVQFVRRHLSPISNICNQLFARNEDDFRSCLHNKEQLITTQASCVTPGDGGACLVVKFTTKKRRK